MTIRQQLKNNRIGVFMGGWSPERNISIQSGTNVLNQLQQIGFKTIPVILNNLDRQEKKLRSRIQKLNLDFAFIVLHGGYGENGGIQNLLKTMNIPFSGSPALACSLAMNKAFSKLIFDSIQIPTAPWIALNRKHRLKHGIKAVFEKFSLPVVVKPVDLGSAIGVTIVKHIQQLQLAVRNAFKYSPWILIEKYISGKEITVGVLGEKTLPIIEIIPQNEFYDYDAKYTPGKSFHRPAQISAQQWKRSQELSIQAGKALGCLGYYRVDMICPQVGEPQVLEVNTVPGFTKTSLFPEAAKAAGYSSKKLLNKIIQLGIQFNGKVNVNHKGSRYVL
jgi:D-alanine-D-alanine ligase